MCYLCAKPRQTSFFRSAFFASSYSFSAIPQNCVSMLLLYWHTTHLPINTMAEFRMKIQFPFDVFACVAVFSAYALTCVCHICGYCDVAMVLWPIIYNDTIHRSFNGFYVHTYIVHSTANGEPTIFTQTHAYAHIQLKSMWKVKISLLSIWFH